MAQNLVPTMRRLVTCGCMISLGCLQGCLLQGCCHPSLTDEAAKELRNERWAENGIEIIGNAQRFAVWVKYMECLNTDDGWLGGETDDLTIELSCDGDSRTLTDTWNDGKIMHSECHEDAINTQWGSNLKVSCPQGSDVIVRFTEEDDLSANDHGSTTMRWREIAVLPEMSQVTFQASIGSVSVWDRIWDEIQGQGICVTDIIPSSATARSFRFSARTQRSLDRFHDAVEAYESLTMAAQACAPLGTGFTFAQGQTWDRGTQLEEVCGETYEFLDEIWNMQCLTAEEGSYKFTLEFTLDGAWSRSCPVMLLFFIFSAANW